MTKETALLEPSSALLDGTNGFLGWSNYSSLMLELSCILESKSKR